MEASSDTQAAAVRRPPDDYSKCFGCGQNNPIGLKLRFRWEGGRAMAEFVPGELHSGWPTIVHGGVVSAALDEATGYVPYFMGLKTVTARMATRFRRTARLGEKLLLSAKATKQAKRIIEVRGEVSLEDGTIVAECSATMYVLRDQEMREYGIE